MSFFRNVHFAAIILLVAQGIAASTSIVREGESSELQVQVVLPESLMEKLEGFEFVLDAYKNIVVKLKDPSTREDK